MSVADKLHAMEAIWADLCRNAPEEAAPDWHLQILEDRERRLAAGQEEVLDWEEAKRRLRQEIHEGQEYLSLHAEISEAAMSSMSDKKPEWESIS